MVMMDEQERKRHLRILIILFIGLMMGALDISIVGPAIPSIERTIHIDARLLSWIFSIYVLFQLTGVSLFAKLSDIYGRRNIYILAVSIFAIGSLVVVISHNFSILLAGRAIQGFGSSGIFPVAIAVVGDIFPPEKRGSALGMIGAVFGIAFIVGPLIAGTLLAFFEWNMLFLINIPIAILLIIGSWKILPSIKLESKSRLDIAGIVLLGIILTCFAIGLNNLKSGGVINNITSLNVYPYILASILLFAVFLFVEKNASSPIVKPQMFFSKQIRLVGLIAVGTGIFQSSIVFIPNFAVSLFSVNSSKASFMLLPVVIASALGSPTAGRLLDKTGSRILVIAGLTFSAFAVLSLSMIGTNIIHFYVTGAIFGLGVSMVMGPSLRYIMLNEVAPQDRALTQGILMILISIGQITGSALIGAVIASGTTPGQGYKNAFLYLSFMIMLLITSAFFLKNRAKEFETIRK
jgi:EmrB/QacA subfamily drug resistance transporter